MDALVGPTHPPENSFTVYEIGDRYKVGRNQARYIVDRLIEQGRAEACGSFGGKKYYKLT